MPENTDIQDQVVWDAEIIRRYDLSGPRYTSYPTAPQFRADFRLDDWRQAMKRSNLSGRDLSIYVHIPFCETVCYYCGCNKVITANRSRAIPYLEAIHKEIALQAAAVDRNRKVVQLHFGGGTPTYLDDHQLSELFDRLRGHFLFVDDGEGEYSIEIHPQTANPGRLRHLRSIGFNRLSLGVQDFNPDVQRAVNRFNSHEEVSAQVSAARELQYRSISLDLIYGLPRQTVESFGHTLKQVVQLRPDRLSLFNYAHMPHLFKVQNQINSSELPEPQEKMRILQNSIETLTRAGYQYIGMDHFALPEDALATAQRQGQLHRNFQGYATHGNCDLLAFGVSAINSLDNTYAQNHKKIEDYQRCLDNNELPLAKGLLLCDDDLLRREVINTLICQFELVFQTIEVKHDISFRNYFKPELIRLKPMLADGLLEMDEQGIRICDRGRLLIRRVCMVFDRYIPDKQRSSDSRYSRII